MARNKVSKQDKSHKEVPQKEKPLETMENPSEKLANLKSLNSFLVKETFERREQIDSLLKSKEDLELEITRSAMEKERLEDQMVAAEIQRSLSLVFVTEKLNQQEEMLRDLMRKEKEELMSELEEKNRKIVQVGNDFRSYRDSVGKDLDLKQKEADLLRSVVVNLEKSYAGAQEEIRRVRMERNGVVEEKAEMERRFEDLKREMVDVVEQRSEVEQVKVERDLMIRKLRKEVDLLKVDLSRERCALEGVLRERDEIQKKLCIEVDEVESLKLKLVEFEKSNLVILGELGWLQSDRDKLVEERNERERTLESLMMDKASIERSMLDFSKLIEDLKGEKSKIVAEKEEIERERANQAMKITELQKEVDKLSVTISMLRREEEGLQLKVSELDKINADILEKQERMRLEFRVLVEEKKESERNFELLMEEKNSTMRSLEEVKINREVEIVELHKEISDLKAAMLSLQELCRNQVETNNTLQSEAERYRDEWDNVCKDLNLKEEEEARLTLEVFELEKGILETKQELKQLKMDCGRLFEEKKEMESNIELLTEDKILLQMSLVKAEEGIEDLRVKMKSAEMRAGQALVMLKNIAEMVCGGGSEDVKGDLAINAEKMDEELQPFAVELDAIKRVFNKKEGKVVDMTQELEFLKNSVVEAHKKRNFWTWLSSATTILAAASLAYVAKGR